MTLNTGLHNEDNYMVALCEDRMKGHTIPAVYLQLFRQALLCKLKIPNSVKQGLLVLADTSI